MGLDVYSSVVVILIVGWLGSLTSQFLRIPRIVCMILYGIALFPVLHPAVMYTPATVRTTDGILRVSDAQNPASSICTLALLIALARGGLRVKFSCFSEIGVTIVVLGMVPYACELIAQGLVAPLLLPENAGFGEGTPPLVVFAAASVWAPLAMAIVVPNMVGFMESGLPAAARLPLVAAPLEAATAILTSGILDSYLIAINQGTDATQVLYFIPVYTFGSALYGLFFASGYLFYTKLRKTTLITRAFGKMDPIEPLFVFLILCVLCFATSNDDINVPRLIGFFAAFSFAVWVQFYVPEIADALCLQLKPVWLFAECFLFVLTGCAIRPAIDSGIAHVLFGPFFAVLLVGQLGRMGGDCLTAFIWQISVLRSAPWQWSGRKWKDLLGRVAFCWVTTIPKAALQATLPVRLSKTFHTGNYNDAANFVGPAAAISVLYMATIGSILTFSAGSVLAAHFQSQEPKSAEQLELESLCKLSPSVVTARRIAVSGNERVAPVVNLLTGLDAEMDKFVASREVTLDVTHTNPSGYLTGVEYDNEHVLLEDPAPKTGRLADLKGRGMPSPLAI